MCYACEMAQLINFASLCNKYECVYSHCAVTSLAGHLRHADISETHNFGTGRSDDVVYVTVRSAYAMQQLYIYAGLLAINAIINSAPLKVVMRFAKVGAIWHVIGGTLPLS